jgi:polysaccharide biosynthesis protein PslH
MADANPSLSSLAAQRGMATVREAIERPVRQPRILFLTCHLPFPPISGGRLRELELIQRLSQRFELHMLVASKTFREDTVNAQRLATLCHDIEVFPTSPLGNGSHGADEPVQVVRHRAPALTRRVSEILAGGRVGLVHVEGFYLMQHLPSHPGCPVLLVEQNVEYELWRQRALRSSATAALRPWRQYAATRRAEIEAWVRARALGVLTPEERDLILAELPHAEVRLMPDGGDHVPGPETSSIPTPRPDSPLLVFVSNFAYAPNVDAARLLCEEILPAVRERVPDVRLWLVGNEPPAEVARLSSEHVVVTGRVDDVVPYIDAADVIVCPLRIGGGVKVKAIEALRRGKALVSTSVGAQGLPFAARDAIVIANEPPAFADAIVRLLVNPDRRKHLERRSAAASRRLLTWDDAAAAVGEAYADLLEDGPRRNGVRRPESLGLDGIAPAVTEKGLLP